ncbi:hypothetical protein DFP72DRAFT_849187 [Ephemerocybe angulata]|uniref:Ubiquitin-like domain-containing protein n=1 Tax=Ephemerocybe angulata TaxID=980116 RepID=A0A8H6HTX6_9AGAR|nr:hypothetical protein DFP72DRAFT_849187 [Tulosesus angulatus]
MKFIIVAFALFSSTLFAGVNAAVDYDAYDIRDYSEELETRDYYGELDSRDHHEDFESRNYLDQVDMREYVDELFARQLLLEDLLTRAIAKKAPAKKVVSKKAVGKTGGGKAGGRKRSSQAVTNLVFPDPWPLAPAIPGHLNIWVKGPPPAGRLLNYDEDPNATILMFKEALHTLGGSENAAAIHTSKIAVAKMELKHEATVLQDTKTFRDYQIPDKAVLYLTIKP